VQCVGELTKVVRADAIESALRHLSESKCPEEVAHGESRWNTERNVHGGLPTSHLVSVGNVIADDRRLVSEFDPNSCVYGRAPVAADGRGRKQASEWPRSVAAGHCVFDDRDMATKPPDALREGLLDGHPQ